MKLLIVDDERIEREALQHFFKSNDLGIEVIGEAANGLQAIELNQSLKPDIITMDIRMGILDGLKATECIKKDNPQVEIIILTAFGLFEYSQQALKNRVFDYLLKPVEEKELISAIKKVKRYIDSKNKTLEAERTTVLSKYWLNQQKEEEQDKDNIFADNRISLVVNHIIDNLEKNLSLKHLASLIHINSSYLSRLFKNTTGVSLSNFIQEVRIEKAKIILAHEPNKPLKNIAEEVGFTNIHHFSNTFKKIEGITPAAYRAQERGQSQ